MTVLNKKASVINTFTPSILSNLLKLATCERTKLDTMLSLKMLLHVQVAQRKYVLLVNALVKIDMCAVEKNYVLL